MGDDRSILTTETDIEMGDCLSHSSYTYIQCRVAATEMIQDEVGRLV